ncbi:SIS domain-containing protein [Companilactobacillus huachuanensis]|uniref:SIS domain-containing protein n=1 Tax=Companilactobacillus huachuanensis TaxID=2559914 RepID=A0ABW1RLD4_9LACO|nr:SIS domain-containing protein [Companilactobacillus huachuanensis]
MKNPTMLTYINKEQEVMSKILDQYPQNIDSALKGMPINMNHWLILATGSSNNAALSAKYYIEKMTGIKIEIEQPYNYSHFEELNYSSDFVIGVSQSGQSTSTIDAIRAIEKVKNIKSMAVTSIPGTEITQCCDTTLDILIGREKVGYVSLGFSATVLNLMLLGLRVARLTEKISAEDETNELIEFRAIVCKIEQTISETTYFVKRNEKELTNANQFSTIAFGPMVGIAHELETKFTETVRIPTHGYELEAYMHGPYLSVNSNHRILFFKTVGTDDVVTKMNELLKYESRYTSHVFLTDFSDDSVTEKRHELTLYKIRDSNKAPILGATVVQVMAWYLTQFHGIDLSHLIFNDFSTEVHNKTQVQNYV